jgi:uncharacterized protein (TIGR02147 family)
MALMALFECRTYIEFLTERAANQHGALLRLANQSGVHPSVISQVMKGKRDLTLEQAMAVAQYFELSGKETSHFLLLVQEARAGTPALKKVMRFQVEESRAANARLAERVKPERALSLDQKAVFYSAWYYSALHLLSVVPAFRAKDALRKRLGLSKERFRAALSYLKEVGLCREKEGFVEALSGSTHLPFDSPLIRNHHANWRLQAINRYERMSPTKEMAFTCPMALSEGDALKVRAKLLAAIEEVCAIADPSPSETVYYLNLDWLEL